MEKNLKKITFRSIIISALLIVVSIILIMHPAEVMHAFLTMVGVTFILVSIIAIFNYFKTPETLKSFFNGDLFVGVVSAIIGLILLIAPDRVVNFVYVLVGIWILFEGLSKLALTLKVRKEIGHIGIILLGILVNILLGAFIIIRPGIAADSIVVACGVVLLISEIITIVETVIIQSNVNKMIELSKYKDVDEIIDISDENK